MGRILSLFFITNYSAKKVHKIVKKCGKKYSVLEANVVSLITLAKINIFGFNLYLMGTESSYSEPVAHVHFGGTLLSSSSQNLNLKQGDLDGIHININKYGT